MYWKYGMSLCPFSSWIAVLMSLPCSFQPFLRGHQIQPSVIGSRLPVMIVALTWSSSMRSG